MMAADLCWLTLMNRAVQVQDVYAEIPKIIADLREENARLGGDDRWLGLMICAQLGQLSLPCRKEGSQ